MRYDRLMNFGWKALIPVGLFWVLATGAIVILPTRYDDVVITLGSVEITRGVLLAVGLVVGVGLLASLVKPLLDRPHEEAR
jgi:hypothetical protein